MKKLIYFMILVSISGISNAADFEYVQSKKAKLMSHPQFKAKIIANLPKGTRVEVLQRRGRWAQVKHEQNQGWLSTLLIAKSQPVNKKSILQETDTQLKEKARRRASDNTTAAATRGLRSDDRARASDRGHANYKALSEVDKVKLSEKEVNEFHQEIENQQ